MNERMDDESGELTAIQEILAPESSTAIVAITAEINQQVATARRFPRRRDKEISDEVMGRACLNEEIASECMYSLKRGTTDITGPSIRFAEIVRASYGNIRVATRFVRLDTEDKDRAAVIVEAAAMDTQTNNAEIIPVRRSVMTSGARGQKPRIYSADMIAQTVSAAVSIARRNAILAVVPKAIWISGYQRVVAVLQGDASTLVERRTKLIGDMQKLGADADKVFAALGVKGIDDITIEHLPSIIGMRTAIKEGESVDSVLGRRPEAEGAAHTVVANPLRDNVADTGNGRTIEHRADDKAAGATSDPANPTSGSATTDKPKPEPDKPKQATATAAAAPRFESAEAYETHASAYIANALSRKALKEQWASERSERVRLFGRDQSAKLEALTEAFMDKNGSLAQDS